jgi:selenocysteine lyase/cysteine desulfurase
MSALLENHASPVPSRAEDALVEAHQCFHGLDELRAAEYGRLDATGNVYLDYTGGSLYAESQVEEHVRMLRDGVYGNPHSINPTSSAATAMVERARSAVLRYFDAPESEYACIFTPNASGAIRLVGEAYPFDRFLATSDNHNSVNGLREFARAKGAATAYVPVQAPDLRVARLVDHLDEAEGASLFAYPAQSNFSGVKHPLEWIDVAHERGWDVLLDCAAFAPTSRLDLSRWQPDFVALSFYKMFGYPTGVGALIARRRALERLQRPWFSGGTVVVATVQREMAVPQSGHAGFEDGTVNYLGIPAVEIGLRYRAGRHRHDHTASREPGQLAAGGHAAARARRRKSRDPCLRAGHLGPPRRHARLQLPAPGWACGRRALRRPRRRGAQHLPPDGLLLQPRCRRGGVLALDGKA